MIAALLVAAVLVPLAALGGFAIGWTAREHRTRRCALPPARNVRR